MKSVSLYLINFTLSEEFKKVLYCNPLGFGRTSMTNEGFGIEFGKGILTITHCVLAKISLYSKS